MESQRILDETGSVCIIYDAVRTFTDCPNVADSSNTSDCDILTYMLKGISMKNKTNG